MIVLAGILWIAFGALAWVLAIRMNYWRITLSDLFMLPVCVFLGLPALIMALIASADDIVIFKGTQE